uniref:Zyg eleven-related protein 1 n=1 Tax=Romanomermis culicivorax TaxID=13658 RepID=A0A915ISZ0_ROMCU
MVDGRMERSTLQNDRSTDVSKLIDVACDYLSENVGLLFKKLSPDHINSPNQGEIYLLPDVFLPRGLGEKVFNKLRRHYLKMEEHNDLYLVKAFAVAHPGAIILDNLDLTDSCINDETLCSLLVSYRQTLRSLDLSGCQNLSRELNYLITSSTFRLWKLNELDLGDLLHLFKDWLNEDKAMNEDEADVSRTTNTDPTDCILPSSDCTTLPATSIFQKLERQIVSSLSKAARLADRDLSGEAKRIRKIARNTANKMVDGSPSVSFTNGNTSTKSSAKHQYGAAENGGDNSLAAGDSGRELMQIAVGCANTSFLPGFELNGCIFEEGQASCSDAFKLCPIDNVAENSILTDVCPNLTKLRLHGSQLAEVFNEAVDEVIDRERLVRKFFERLLLPLQRLKTLDISCWAFISDLSFLDGIKLSSLILYDVPHLHRATDIVCSIKTLHSQDTGQYIQPVTTLSKLIANLPHLKHLDISFTNLASNPVKGDWPEPPEKTIESDIYGLQGLKQKLDYLGLFACDTAAYYHRIPAHNITGEANESQMLLALEQYINRPSVILAVLNEIFQVYRFNVASDYTRALHLMLVTMETYKNNVSVQIASSASLFYIMRNVNMNLTTKHKAIRLLLDAIDMHPNEQTLIRNCCLSMCQFDIAQDMSHFYLDTFRILIRVLKTFDELTIHRLVVHILNTLACAGQNDQKIVVGEMGAIVVLLDLIRGRLDTSNCDEVMETAWSFLWNITDETPTNCRTFLDKKGMELFQKCYAAFTSKHGLMRNMMGLIGNIAEVKELRGQLMVSSYIQIFWCHNMLFSRFCSYVFFRSYFSELLHNLSEDIEISYNSAGVLAHMLSDSYSSWTSTAPTREEVSTEVISVAKSWLLNSKRFINYRSFEPIIRLLHAYHSPASQYWAAWALANLTTVDEVGRNCATERRKLAQSFVLSEA